MIPIMLIASLAQQQAQKKKQDEQNLINTLHTPEQQNTAQSLLGNGSFATPTTGLQPLNPMDEEEKRRRQMFGL
jgi:hypothetical protein